LILHMPPGGTLEPHELVWLKSPVVTMLVTIRGEPPVFVKLTVCAGLVVPTNVEAKVRVTGERRTAGAATPVPVKSTTWGLPAALSVMVRAAMLGPGAVGVKVTLTTQLVVGWSGVAMQSLVCAKAPLAFTDEMVKGVVAWFVTVTAWGLLVTLTC